METKTIKESELKKGDILLYSVIEPPKFIPPSEEKSLKDLIKDNFGILVDKLIIWTENSNTTHAALVYDFINKEGEPVKARVVESTLPYCQLRSPIQVDNFTITARRLPENLDGSVVLNELPPPSENNEDNNGYALAQASIAALLILLRTRLEPQSAKDRILLPKLLTLLKLLSYPIGKRVDSILPFNKDGKTPFFCSQLVAWCYDMTALKLNNPAYKVNSPSNSKLGDTLLDYLLKNCNLDAPDSDELLSDSELDSEIDLDSPEIMYAACKIFDEPSAHLFLSANSEPKLYSALLEHSEDLQKSLPSIKKLIKNILILLGKKADIDKYGLAKTIIDFQTSFIMPSDLENVFENAGEVVNV